MKYGYLWYEKIIKNNKNEVHVVVLVLYKLICLMHIGLSFPVILQQLYVSMDLVSDIIYIKISFCLTFFKFKTF